MSPKLWLCSMTDSHILLWCSGGRHWCLLCLKDSERRAVLLCSALCYQQTADGVVPGARLSMKANITGHKDILQAGDMLLQKGGVGLNFLHHNRKNYASTCETTYKAG